VKPFGSAQIEARIRAVLGRPQVTEQHPSDTLHIGGLGLDARRHIATLDGEVLDLGPIEFKFLSLLARHSPNVVERREIFSEVWGRPDPGNGKTLGVHLSDLRRKLGETAEAPRYLHTVWGGGIKMEPPAA
jgi:DNA-binding response OmpR family regulator